MSRRERWAGSGKGIGGARDLRHASAGGVAPVVRDANASGSPASAGDPFAAADDRTFGSAARAASPAYTSGTDDSGIALHWEQEAELAKGYGRRHRGKGGKGKGKGKDPAMGKGKGKDKGSAPPARPSGPAGKGVERAKAPSASTGTAKGKGKEIFDPSLYS